MRVSGLSSLYRGFRHPEVRLIGVLFHTFLALAGLTNIVIVGTSLYQGSLYQGSTVVVRGGLDGEFQPGLSFQLGVLNKSP